MTAAAPVAGRGLRLDRAVSVRMMHPAARILHRREGRRIPILMYHGIRSTLRRSHPYFETSTSPALFRAHMRFLAENGYRTIGLEDAVAALRTGGADGREVVITFDDGYRDFHSEAFPILSAYGLRATVFVVAGLTADRRVVRDGEEYLTWGEVRQLHRHGIGIGSHTMTHPELHSLSSAQIDAELRQSKRRIEDELGSGVTSFAYPFAFPEQDRGFVRRMGEMLEGNGYRYGVSTVLGTASRRHRALFLPRLPVNSYDDLRFFAAKLAGGYDWLHSFQYLSKRLKAVI